MNIRAVAGLLMSLGLIACQSVKTGAVAYFDNPVSVGAELELVEPLHVPAGLARVYLQGGEIHRYAGIDQYQPFCYFLMHAPSPLGREIRPAIFSVLSIDLREQDVRLATPLRVAHNGVLASSSDGPGVIAFETRLLLNASKRSDPEWLVCSGAFAAPSEAAPIRLAEMRLALGSRVIVRVQGSSGP